MEQDEFTTVYRQFYRPLYVYALSLSGNRSDALELVQSTFLKALLSNSVSIITFLSVNPTALN